MDREAVLVRELESLDAFERDELLDDELAGEDAETEVELLEARVRAARLAGA
jgi:hypothetical protein